MQTLSALYCILVEAIICELVIKYHRMKCNNNVFTQGDSLKVFNTIHYTLHSDREFHFQQNNFFLFPCLQ